MPRHPPPKRPCLPLAALALLGLLLALGPARAEIAPLSAPPDSAAPAVATDEAPAAASPPVEAAAAPPDTVDAAAEVDAEPDAPPAVERFDIWEYRISGTTRLPRQTVERLVYPFLGPGRVFEDVEGARAALEDAYRAAGYGTALVTIPLQEVAEGVVTLEVVEGMVSRLKVVGSRYFSLGRILEKVPALAQGQVPNLDEAQRQLADLNALSPDRSITPVLRAGRTPGTVEVDLKVEDRSPLHGEVEFNDRFAPDTTRTRLNASVRYDNLWQREHSLGVAYQVAPEDRSEVEVFSGTYVFKVPDSKQVVALYAVRSNTDIAAVGTLGVLGTGTILGGRYIVPLTAITPAGYFHSATFGLDYKDFGEVINRLGVDQLNVPIDYHRFSAAYAGGLNREQAETDYGIEMAWGVRGLGNTQEEFAERRFRGEPNYLFFRGNFAHEQRFWRGISGRARLAGQLAMAPLIANEQFAAGGVLSVRGYPESARLGDDGVNMSFELRSPELLPVGWTYIPKLNVYAFTDAAWLRVQDSLPGEQPEHRLASAGLGVEGSLLGEIDFNLEWARALSTVAFPVADDGDPATLPPVSTGNVRSGDDRLHFRVGYQF